MAGKLQNIKHIPKKYILQTQYSSYKQETSGLAFTTLVGSNTSLSILSVLKIVNASKISYSCNLNTLTEYI